MSKIFKFVTKASVQLNPLSPSSHTARHVIKEVDDARRVFLSRLQTDAVQQYNVKIHTTIQVDDAPSRVQLTLSTRPCRE
jgi:hypothetical protein